MLRLLKKLSATIVNKVKKKKHTHTHTHTHSHLHSHTHTHIHTHTRETIEHEYRVHGIINIQEIPEKGFFAFFKGKEITTYLC